MKAYAVRLGAEQKHPREIVGFFFAGDLDELCRQVDECCEVEGCEVLELDCGGIYWDMAVGYVVPIEESEIAPALPSGGSLTGSWMEALCAEGEWIALTWPDD